MRKTIALRSIISWLLLLIVMSALVAGMKAGVSDVRDAAFFPVASPALTLGYMLGFSTSSARRAWGIMPLGGFLLAFIESTKLIEPVRVMIQSIPRFELEIIQWIFRGENIEAKFPDTSIFHIQLTEITTRANTFISEMVSLSFKSPSVREFLWDIPLLFLAAWAGWQTSRHNEILLALAPTLGFHAFILDYTGKDTFSLQIAVFGFILLMGVNQEWNFVRVLTESSERAVRETYPAILLLSIALAFVAGITPSISISEVSQKFTRRNEIAKAIGLEREREQAITASGLPRQHIIGPSPKLSQTVIFTIKTGEIAPTESTLIKETLPRHYWRWLTYDIYNGRGWTTSPISNNPYPANQLLLPISNESQRVVHIQVEKALTQDDRLYFLGSLVSASETFQASWRTTPAAASSSEGPFLSADMLGAITEKKIYEADTLLPIASANQLRASSQNYPPEMRTRYLSLPETVPNRVLELAEKLTANITNPYDKAKVIEAYLREYPYSLNVAAPPPNQDVSDYFLFDLQTGYCDYYATSMIVLARAAGLPARLVIGYANGTYDPVNAEYVVRDADAHSWVEIYFTGAGWIEFEPTASQAQITLPNELPRAGILGPVLLISPEQRAATGMKELSSAQRAALPLVIGLSLVIVLSSAWFLHTNGLLIPHTTIGSIYGHVYYHGKKIYRDAPLDETPSAFADNLLAQLRTGSSWLIPAPNEVKLLTNLYIQETYSAHPITKDECAMAVTVWRKLFWRLLYARVLRR